MALSGKRILVTGGAGFIGSCLVERLAKSGSQVFVLDNLSSGYESNLLRTKSVTFYHGDVRDEEAVAKLVKKSDLVFHLAEFIPNTEKYGAGHVVKFSVDHPLVEFDVSCRGTLVVLENVRKYSKKLIFTSTAAVYGETDATCINENQPTLPISPYGASKLCAETYLQLYRRIYDLPIVTLRLFNVYGPKQRKYVMYDVLRKLAINSSELEILGTGDEERDFIYVDDVVDALLLVAEREDAIGQVFNVGSGTATKLRNLIKMMLDFLGEEPNLVFTNSSWKGNLRRLCADVTKLQKLGFSPKYQLQNGLKSLIDWFNSSERRVIQSNGT
jgi:UDP-glucose 4-epimerase